MSDNVNNNNISSKNGNARESKFLAAFTALTTEAGNTFELYSDCLIVEEIPAAEVKTKSGLILDSGGVRKIDGLDMNKPLFVRVLAVGAGYYDEVTGKDVPLEVQVGDVILTARMAVQWFSTFGPLVSHQGFQIGLTRESDIRMRFKGEAGWQAATAVLQKYAGNFSTAAGT